MIINENLNPSSPDISSVELHEKLIALMRSIQDKNTPERKQGKVPVDPTRLIGALKAMLPESSHQDLDSFSDYLSQNTILDEKFLLAYAKLMYAVEKNGIAEEHATKLYTLLGDVGSAFKYLNACFKAGAGSPKTLHDACLFVLPRGEYDLKVWRELSKKFLTQEEFRKYILPQAGDIEALIKANQAKAKPKAEEISQAIKEIQGINAIIKNLESIRGKGQKGLNEAQKSELADKKRSKLEKQLELTAKGIHFNKDLAVGTLQAFRERFVIESSQSCALLLKNGLTKKDYAKFIGLTRQNDDVKIPNVKVESSEPGLEGITISKVDVMDELQAAEAACFGKLTDCCQSLSGEAGEPCVVHGLTSPYGGFYVVKNHANEVLGQCWAWRSQSGAIVFDSIEIANKDKAKEASMMLFNQLAEKLVQDGYTDKISCGARSGISHYFGVATNSFKEYQVDDSGHSDSINQRVLFDKKRPYLFYPGKRCSEEELNDYLVQIIEDKVPEKNIAFIEMLNWAIFERKEVIGFLRELLVESPEFEKYNKVFKGVFFFLASEDKVLFMEKNGYPEFLVNIKNKDGETALMLAAERGLNDAALKLIEKGANIDEKSNDGTTALMRAALKGHKDIALKLIERGANIDEKDSRGQTALMYAALYGHSDIALKLIERGANIDEKDCRGRKALWHAEKDIAFKLIEEGANIDERNNEGNTILMEAVYNCLKIRVLELIELGANIEEKNRLGQTVLMQAILISPDIVFMLIDKGAKLDEKDSEGKTALMIAVEHGNLLEKVAFKLIEKGANLDEKDKEGKTALMYAVSKGHRDIVLKLMEQGANIHEKDNQGKTALMYAALYGHSDIVLKLMEQGAKIDEKTKFGKTALMLAARAGRSDVVLRLIEKGANINEMDNEGKTALMMVSEELKASMMERADEISSSARKEARPPLLYRTKSERSKKGYSTDDPSQIPIEKEIKNKGPAG